MAKSYKSFDQFLTRRKFKIRDLPPNDLDMHARIRLMQTVFNNELLHWHLKSDEYGKFVKALALAGYMSAYEIDQLEPFAQCVSALNDEEWLYALRFCPYHNIAVALKNLTRIKSALEQEYLGLQAALAKMTIHVRGQVSIEGLYENEVSRVITHMMSFSAFYGAYLDTSRRIRKLAKLDSSPEYDRAILRVIRKNQGLHAFVVGLRNYQLHYGSIEPVCSVTRSDHMEAKLYMAADKLLYSGFKWKLPARQFLQKSKELDLIDLVSITISDVKKLIRFQEIVIHRRLRNEKKSYDSYLHERQRFKQLSAAVFDMGAVFHRPTTLLSRLVKQEFVTNVLESALTDKQAAEMLFNMANRYKNLNSKLRSELRIEIESLTRKRTRFSTAGSYVMGQPHN